MDTAPEDRRRALSRLLFLVITGLLLASPVEANLLTNGSFEIASVPPGTNNLTAGATDITGWLVTRDQIGYVGDEWLPSDGSRSLDLDGTPGAGAIAQTFATDSGSTYIVTFDLAGHPSGPPTIKRMEVQAAGQSADFDFDITGHSKPNDMGWVTHVWSFVANNSQTTLEFLSLDTNADPSWGPALDNVQVVAASPCGLLSIPAENCRLVTQPLKSKLQLKDKTTDAKDMLNWQWRKGVATTLGDFKDPVNGTASYRFCIYDASANIQPLLTSDILPGGTCGTKLCWKESRSAFLMRNKAGAPNGITNAKLVAGLAGKSSVQLAGKGVNVPMPTLGLTLPVTAQLVISDGVTSECFQTTYSTAKKNDVNQFKAQGP